MSKKRQDGVREMKRGRTARLLMEPSWEEEQHAATMASPFQESFKHSNSQAAAAASCDEVDFSEDARRCHDKSNVINASSTMMKTTTIKTPNRGHKRQLSSLLMIIFGGMIMVFLHSGSGSVGRGTTEALLQPVTATTAASPTIRPVSQAVAVEATTTARPAANYSQPMPREAEMIPTKQKLPGSILVYENKQSPGGGNLTTMTTTPTPATTSVITTPVSVDDHAVTTNVSAGWSTAPEVDGAAYNDTSSLVDDSEPTAGTTDAPATATSALSLSTSDEESDIEAEDDGKLSSLIIDTANVAADQLVGRLRGSGGTDDSATSDGADDDAEANNRDPGEREANENGRPSSGAAVDDRLDDDERSSTSDADQLKQSEKSRKRQVDSTVTTANGSDNATTAASEELRLAMRTYAKWRSVGDDIIELFSKKLLPLIVEHGYEVDAVTVSGMLQVFNGIRALQPWALKLLDSWAKITPGLLVGTQSDFGDFDECLSVRVDDPSGLATESGQEIDQTTGLKSSSVVGRYCLADVEFPKPPRERLATRNEELQTDLAPIELRRPLLNFSETAAFKDTIFVETGNFFHMLYVDPIRVGICLTNKVDPDSFAQVFNKIFEEFRITINFRGRCATKYDRPTWTIYQKVSAYVVAVACSLVVLCTGLDLLHTKLNKLPLPTSLQHWKLRFKCTMFRYRPLFTSFSIIRNTKRLFKPQQQRRSIESKASSAKMGNLNLKFAMGSRHTAAAQESQLHLPLASHSSPSSSSLESSPSIERRSSVTSSAVNLIGEPQKQHQVGGANSKKLLDPSFVQASGVLHDGHMRLEQAAGEAKPLQDDQSVNLLCLHGIRVITMSWMIVNHTYMFGGFFVLWAHRRLIDIAEWPRSMSFQLVLNGWLTVETYFFLSATIIALNVMPLMGKKKFAYFAYIFHRLVRLLPAYIGLICLNFLWPLISSGPVWLVKGKSFIQDPCENYLWTNFLFINNWIWPEKQCMVHTWFLSADFQLYLLAPILVYLMYRRPALGHSLNIIVAILASCLSGFVIYANKLMPTTLINKLEFDSIKQQLSYSYFATYQHMGPYCLGIFVGYLLHKRPQVQLPKHLTWLLWLLLPPLSFTTLLLTYLWNGAYDEPELINPSPLVSAFYVAIHRTIWTSLVAWIVFACSTGRAKLLSSFLSHHMFIPLSRLSFSIYLVHLPVIMFRALNLRHTIEWTDSNILWEACGNFIVSLVVGYFVNIAFESPFINLEQVIFGNRGKVTEGEAGGERADAREQQVPKERTLLRPQLEASKGNTDNDSDDYKSRELAMRKHSADSSSSSDILATRRSAAEKMHHQNGWLEAPEGRKALKPKENSSVERIFGRLEPRALASPHISQRLSKADSQIASALQRRPQLNEAPHNQFEQHQRASSTLGLGDSALRPVRRYSAHEAPPATMDATNLHDGGSSLYYVNYARPLPTADHHNQRFGSTRGTVGQLQRGQHQYRINTGGYVRPPQYATLARTSRFNHDANETAALSDQRQRIIDYQRQQTSLFMATDAPPPPRPRSHLGESISRLANPAQADHRSPAAWAPADSKHHHHNHHGSHLVPRRRPGRYNTLIGTGAREWHQERYAAIANEASWQTEQEELDGEEANSSSFADSMPSWLQPGSLLPRIDSSTMRRAQTKRSADNAPGSIVEEPTYEVEEEEGERDSEAEDQTRMHSNM